MKSFVIGAFALVGMSLLAGVPAHGQGEKSARYSMTPAEGGGFVRLDTQTGQMWHCRRRDEEWSCREMAEPGLGLGSEVERLGAENKRLKAEMRQMEDILLGDKRRAEGRGQEFKLPSEQDLDNAMSYAQRMLRKFREKLREFEANSKGTPL